MRSLFRVVSFLVFAFVLWVSAGIALADNGEECTEQLEGAPNAHICESMVLHITEMIWRPIAFKDSILNNVMGLMMMRQDSEVYSGYWYYNGGKGDWRYYVKVYFGPVTRVSADQNGSGAPAVVVDPLAGRQIFYGTWTSYEIVLNGCSLPVYDTKTGQEVLPRFEDIRGFFGPLFGYDGVRAQRDRGANYVQVDSRDGTFAIAIPAECL